MNEVNVFPRDSGSPYRSSRLIFSSSLPDERSQFSGRSFVFEIKIQKWRPEFNRTGVGR